MFVKQQQQQCLTRSV